MAVEDSTRFADLSELNWKESFYDPCTSDWRRHWFLDGKKAAITHDSAGMNFCAGPVFRENASHAVLWTKKSFSGDIRIEYDYTRTDSSTTPTVTIIYIQATGINRERYKQFWDTDIAAWSDRRIEPKMNLYFLFMNALHISYAAFEKQGEGLRDYVRARRYPVPEEGHFGRDTKIPSEYLNAGMFETGVPYHITIIKKGRELYMHARGPRKEKLFALPYDQFEPVTDGRIGLRHMYTRCARYKDIRISVLGKK